MSVDTFDERIAPHLPYTLSSCSSPTALLDSDGDAALVGGDGRPCAWAPLRQPRCLSEAQRFARLWQRATGERL